jgi:hypothetical protein
MNNTPTGVTKPLSDPLVAIHPRWEHSASVQVRPLRIAPKLTVDQCQ